MNQNKHILAPVPRAARRFYDSVYGGNEIPEAAKLEGRDEDEYRSLSTFLEDFHDGDGPVLDVGCGHGSYQDVVSQYIGTDLSMHCGRFVKKPYVVASATALPFQDHTMRAVLSLHALEHVHDPEAALLEMLRVLQPGGALYLLPSWQVRPWASSGLAVRPWSELGFSTKLARLLVPVRDSVLVRGLRILPRRLMALARHFLGLPANHLRYRPLKANYDTYLVADSDACNWLDGFDVMLFLRNQGCIFPEYPGWKSKLGFRTGPLVVIKRRRTD